MEPVLQLLQLAHLTLAIILPLEIPEPAMRVTSAASLCVGITWPEEFLGLMVTFNSSAELCITNMLALLIAVPCASATHEYDVGAESWKKMSPDSDLLDVSGTLTAKQTSLAAGQVLKIAASVPLELDGEFPELSDAGHILPEAVKFWKEAVKKSDG